MNLQLLCDYKSSFTDVESSCDECVEWRVESKATTELKVHIWARSVFVSDSVLNLRRSNVDEA